MYFCISLETISVRNLFSSFLTLNCYTSACGASNVYICYDLFHYVHISIITYLFHKGTNYVKEVKCGKNIVENIVQEWWDIVESRRAFEKCSSCMRFEWQEIRFV